VSRRANSVLFVNQHYWPDVASTGQHLTDLCEYLAARGFDVAVLTGRAKYTAGAVEAPREESHNGVHIQRLSGTKFGRKSHLGRIVDYASFYVGVLRQLLAGPKHAGVIFLTTPPIVPFAGWLARRLRGQRYGVWSMDLHPEAEIEAGMVAPTGLLTRILRWTSDVGYRGADVVVDLGAYMKQRIGLKGVPASRTRTIHVWSSKEELVPVARDDNPLRRELGLEDKFVVMYSGNAGLVHDFDAILDAMRRLDGDDRIRFLFVGDGPRRKEIEAFAAEHRLSNFQYRPYFPRDQLRWSLPLADVHLISLRAPFVGVAVPGKLYGIMGAARAALFVGPERCESADSVRDARCGAVVDSASRSRGDSRDGRSRSGRLPRAVRARAQLRRVGDNAGRNVAGDRAPDTGSPAGRRLRTNFRGAGLRESPRTADTAAEYLDRPESEPDLHGLDRARPCIAGHRCFQRTISMLPWRTSVRLSPRRLLA